MEVTTPVFTSVQQGLRYISFEFLLQIWHISIEKKRAFQTAYIEAKFFVHDIEAEARQLPVMLNRIAVKMKGPRLVKQEIGKGSMQDRNKSRFSFLNMQHGLKPRQGILD